MDPQRREKSVLRFGQLELDLKASELRRNGVVIKLPLQSFKVLAILASRGGQLVTRKEIQEQIWGDDTYVDFDQGLAHCIHQIRQALKDNSRSPRYIETLPRRGYRFLPDTTTSKIQALAVLPFANLSGDPDQEYLADGLTESLITELGKIGSFRIISRQSIMRFKHSHNPLPEIAHSLNVQALVEGALMREGDQVRVTAQLVAVEPERHVWADVYERNLASLLELVNDVARTIAQQLKGILTKQESASLNSDVRVRPEAHEAYLRGLYLWNRRTGEDLVKAVQYFQRAIDKDSSYAHAYAALADTYTMLAVYQGPPKEFFPMGLAAARKSLELNSSIAESHASLAMIQGLYLWDWASAIKGMKNAIKLNPSCATARHWYAAFLSVLGNDQKALAEITLAQKLDPLSPQINTRVGVHLYYLHKYDLAIKSLLGTLDLYPRYAIAHYSLGQAYLKKEMYDEAIYEFEKGTELGLKHELVHGLAVHDDAQ